MSIDPTEIAFIFVATVTLRGLLYFLSISQSLPGFSREIVRLVDICLTVAFFGMVYRYLL